MKVPATLAIKLNKAAEKAVKQGHPWVFEQSIIKGPSKNAQAGSLCVLFDQRTNKPFAFGLWDPEEVIRIKIIFRAGRLQLSADFWKSQLNKAYVQRENLRSKGVTGYRGIHGENDGFPGLVLDVYNKTGVLKIYSRIWQPYTELLIQEIKKQFALDTMVVRFSRKVMQQNPFAYQEGEVIGNPLPDEKVAFGEYGVRFYAYTISGHKTGFFLDQRPNRLWVQQHSDKKKVLDVFSYVGSFGIHALKGNAKSLTSIDISAPAMEVAAQNMVLNELDQSKWTPMVADAFTALQELIDNQEQFDIVIIDPPSFAKQATEVPRALTQYQRLAQLGKELVAKNGTLVLGSCSSRISLDDFKQAHQDAGITPYNGWEFKHTTLHDEDHPITFPESVYLKTVFYQKV